MPGQPACELLWVESASFKKEPVLAGCQRQIIGKEVDRIIRVVVEDEQLVGLVLPVEIPHEVRDRIGQADSAGLADRVMEAFHLLWSSRGGNRSR